MPSNEMAKLIESRKRQVKKKKKQTLYGILVIIFTLIIFFYLLPNNKNNAVCWIIGIGFGIVLRYSRFCFTAAFRDPILIGDTRLIRGVILALIISTVGFAVIQAGYLDSNDFNYNFIPGEVSAVGIHVAIGAFMFGIGMVIAGGCASGVLMRIGEGHMLQIVVLVGFLIGTILGAKDYSFWYEHIIHSAKIIYFSEYLNFKLVVVLQIIVLIILYRFAIYYENRRFKDI
ncbi:YeeE/YedE thiosulfate transporter family protein [Abyssisolibacter fermentans]|uniref:YeeE/YedE thiosulfate transporter family protein n=1 Tax=Abyssisolibacter fermentans TaxID=1766203 RepID=UPI00082D9568|nr:YeeE/YedE thiosulfate transporter family protein [Abyssisolibacter fermentans]